jgi:hypothetical protein
LIFFGPIDHTQISVILTEIWSIDPNQKRGSKIEKFVFSIPDHIFARSKISSCAIFFYRDQISRKFLNKFSRVVEIFQISPPFAQTNFRHATFSRVRFDSLRSNFCSLREARGFFAFSVG